jgi:DNA helicase-2/ATP-dependent DNA helicase PcrA
MEGEDDTAELDDEDEALLLRLYQLRVGPLKRKGRPIRYSHLVVDEVQDLAPIEVAVLVGCADRHQSVTLAGDTQQHVLAQSGFGSWDTLLSTLGGEQIALSSLEVGYRSTARISAFAYGLLGDLAEGKPGVATREGPEVELFPFTDHGACVAFLADALSDLMRLEPQASIALLARRPDIAQIYYDGLIAADLPHTRRVVDQTFAFEAGVEVTEVSEVKGLEFDYVVLLETSAACYPDDAFSRRLLHVGATRACHQLWLTVVETPSPILRRTPR